jgi:hypothetical protein
MVNSLECVDDSAPDEGAELLASRLGIPGLWPLAPQSWDEDTFLGLIEVFHDLAVRPRERNMHSYSGCGWHYSAFNSDTGRRLYRWQVNRLLDTAGLGLQLAGSGQDVGRLVYVSDDARTELVERVLQTPDTGTADRVAHAITQFRGRDATEHDKRSAVITLAGVLEERRELIKAELGRKDEGALFTLANEFAVRHQRRGQQGDYDPAFLNWMVWWYLGTIEVTNRILARQDVRNASASSARRPHPRLSVAVCSISPTTTSPPRPARLTNRLRHALLHVHSALERRLGPRLDRGVAVCSAASPTPTSTPSHFC